jgi:hypothetical protein
MKEFWSVSAYDKTFGDEIWELPVSEEFAKELLDLMGYTDYQDCYDITKEGLELLLKKGYIADVDKYDYQLEVWGEAEKETERDDCK